MLEAINVKKRIGEKPYQVDILHGISLTVSNQEMVAIMGPSGCGKSTLLGILAGLDKPSHGTVLLNGQDVYALPEKKRNAFRCQNTGVIFQSQNLINELTCYENIILPLVFAERSAVRKQQAFVDELISMVGLADKRKLYPYQMSGGEQQRAGIIRTLFTHPKILFADEPTGSLDQANSQSILSLLRRSTQKYHHSVVMVTHDEQVASMCDRTIRMRDGMLEGDML
jgi:putative ABC transport system ATP-binding protein